MARTRGTTRSSWITVFPCRSLQQQLVDPLPSGSRDEFEEDDSDQETEKPKQREIMKEKEKENMEDFERIRRSMGTRDPKIKILLACIVYLKAITAMTIRAMILIENEQCRTQPGMSRDFSDPERDTGTMKEENNYETGMDRLRVWLDRMGLGRYVPLFEFNDVDGEVLQFLTLYDLKDMGVSAVGSRWKIYCYIQKNCI